MEKTPKYFAIVRCPISLTNDILRFQRLVWQEFQFAQYREDFDIRLECDDGHWVLQCHYDLADGVKHKNPHLQLDRMKSMIYRWKLSLPFYVKFCIDDFNQETGAIKYRIRWPISPVMKSEEDMEDDATWIGLK